MQRTQAVHQCLRPTIREADRLTIITAPPTSVDESVGTLRPLQGNIRAMQRMESEEFTIQPPAFLLQNAHDHFRTSAPQPPDTSTRHLLIRISQPTTTLRNPFSTNNSAQGGVLPQ